MENNSHTASTTALFFVLLVRAMGVAMASWMAHSLFSFGLSSRAALTIRLIWIAESLIMLPTYGLLRLDHGKCSLLRAMGRGLLSLPAGALLNALGAISLGAPVGLQFLAETTDWALLMSSLNFVPPACVFGSSWSHWRRVLAEARAIDAVEYVVGVPALGAVIGAWLGAWPMPLDWERPWQRWPVCVTFGALSGYFLGVMVALALVHLRSTPDYSLAAPVAVREFSG